MLYDPKQEQRIVLRQQIEDTIAVIKRYGWTQINLRDEHGACIVGAMEYAAHHAGWDNREPIFDYMTKRASLEGRPSIAKWNDAPGRTKRQVFAFLRTAQRAL